MMIKKGFQKKITNFSGCRFVNDSSRLLRGSSRGFVWGDRDLLWPRSSSSLPFASASAFYSKIEKREVLEVEIFEFFSLETETERNDFTKKRELSFSLCLLRNQSDGQR